MADLDDDLLPVNERVTAPPSHRPAHPLVAEWRPATDADVSAVTEAQRAMDAVDHPEWLHTREEVEELFGYSFIDLATDTILGFGGDGRLVAVGVTTMPPLQESLVRVFLEGGVHPEVRGRGIGRELLAWSRARAEQKVAASTKRLPVWILAYADERSDDAIRLFHRDGFETVRYFFNLERDLADPIPAVEPADGFRIAPFSDELSADALIAHNDSFRDHWGSQPMSEEQWAAWIGGTFRADVSFLALRGDEVVGFVLNQVNEGDWQTQGFTGAYIGMVGTVRSARGKRIAPALLGRAMEACKALGWEKVTLSVDAENPSGALGLYTGMGFVRTTAEVSLVREY